MVVPPQTKNDDATEELMPVAQALREFAPGRVSRRFGINNTYNRHWLAHGEVSDDREQTVSIDEAYEYESLGDFLYESNEGLREMAVVRPEKIRNRKGPSKIPRLLARPASLAHTNRHQWLRRDSG